jgi:hypothetical protein
VNNHKSAPSYISGARKRNGQGKLYRHGGVNRIAALL